MHNHRFYFNGCSITNGHGFKYQEKDSRLYTNLVSKNHVNHASRGASNLKIFLQTSNAIIDRVADIYVVQWSGLHRHWVYPAPDKGIYFGSPKDPNNEIVTENDKLIAHYQLLNHDYGNIMQLLDFCRILQVQARRHNCRLIFINGIVEWSNNEEWMYKLVADAEDHDIAVERLKNNIELVDWNLWVNPWCSFYTMSKSLDLAEDNLHPGPKTHKQIADMLKEKFQV